MKIFKLIIIGLIIISGIVCTAIKPDEYVPSDEDYKGDYKFEISIEDLTSDTLEIFKEYSISFASTGVDSFKSYAVCDSAGNNITDTVNFDFSDNDSCIILYFKAPYKGALTFKAIRPNGQNESVKLKDSITILNPYITIVDSTVGKNSTNKAEVQKYYKPDSIPSGLKIRWEIDTSINMVLWPDTQSFQTFSFTVDSLDANYSVFVIDTFNQQYLIKTMKIRVEGNSPVIEDVKILPDSINIGDTLSVSVLVTDDDALDSFRLYVSAPLSGVMTSDTSKYLASDSSYKIVKFVKPILDTGEINLSIMAKGKLGGLSSNVKTKNIEVHYTLPKPLFGDTIKQVNIGDTSSISFVDNNYEEGTKYYWVIPEMAFKCTTITNNIDIPFLNEDTVNVFIKGINRFGHYGNTDSLKIVPQDFSYTVDIVESHDILASNKSYTFKALVKNDIGDIVTERVKYYWSTVGTAVIIDSASVADSSFYTIKVNNESSPFKVKVIATIHDTIETPAAEHPVSIDKKPIVVFQKDPMSVVLGNELICTLTVTDNGTIDSVYVLLNSSIIEVAKDTTNNSDLYFCNLPGDSYKNDTVFVWAVDNEGNSSDTVSALFEKTSDKPAFTTTFDSSSVYILDTVTIKLPEVYPGNDQSTIIEYQWDLDGDSVFDTTTVADSMFVLHESPYDGIITVAAVNNLNETSVVNFQYHLVVLLGEPEIANFKVDASSSSKAFINEFVLINMTAIDRSTNGKIVKLNLDYTGDGIADVIDTITSPISPYQKTFPLKFSAGGNYILTGWAEDDHGNLSTIDTLDSLIVIDQGVPVIDSLSRDSLIYINDTHSYTIHATDPNGDVIGKYYWSKDSVTFDSLGDFKNFSTAFSNSGWNYIYLKAKDSINEAVAKDSVYIELGKPFADSIKGDTISWVNDTARFTFYYHDVNDSIDSVSINWGDSATVYSYKVVDSGKIFLEHVYPISEDTTYQISLIVKDNDGVLDTTTQNVEVNKGYPSIDSSTPDSVWIIDTVSYTIYFDDSNGYIDSFWVNWNSDSSSGWESAVAIDSGVDTALIQKHFAKSDTGWNNYWVKVQDDDGILVSKRCSVFVKLGSPIIGSGASYSYPIQWVGDTMFYVYDGGNPVIAVDTSDSNGKIEQFFWDAGNDGVNDTTTDPFWQQYLPVNVATEFAVWGLDDDSLFTNKFEFLAYPDKVPVKPVLGNPTISSDSITFEWLNADEKDGDNTEFQILFGTTNPPIDTIKEFSTSPKNQNDRFYFVFRPETSGTYYWRVISRDARGSTTPSDVSPFLDFTKP